MALGEMARCLQATLIGLPTDGNFQPDLRPASKLTVYDVPQHKQIDLDADLRFSAWLVDMLAFGG